MTALSPQQVQQALQQQGDFLALTRANTDSLPAVSFELFAGQERAIRVSVIDTGIMVVEPISETSQKDIVLSCAVHGNETAPIEICQQLIEEILGGQWQLTERVLFLFGNPDAINISERFVEENLNRLFSGAHSEGAGCVNKERVRAKQLEDNVREFFTKGEQSAEGRHRIHYDLHTAIRGSKNDKFAVYPFRHGKPWKNEQLQMMRACGVSTILLSHSPTTTFSYFSSNEFGADAFTVELGKVRPFGENDMKNFAATKQTLTALLSRQPISIVPYDANDFDIFEIYQIIDRHHQDFTLHFADDAENFTDFPLDYVLATDGEKEHKVTKEGEAIIFPNAHVALGQRALLTVVPVDIKPE